MKDTVVMILGALVFAAAGARASTTYFPAMPGTPGTSNDSCTSGKCLFSYAAVPTGVVGERLTSWSFWALNGTPVAAGENLVVGSPGHPGTQVTTFVSSRTYDVSYAASSDQVIPVIFSAGVDSHLIGYGQAETPVAGEPGVLGSVRSHFGLDRVLADRRHGSELQR